MTTARDVALSVLTAVQTKNAYSNIAMQHALSRAAMDDRDAGLATEIVFGALQYQNVIDYALSGVSSRKIHTLDATVLNLLRLSVYQLAFLDRVPAHAVVHEAVELAKRHCPRAQGFVNGILRKLTPDVRDDFAKWCNQGGVSDDALRPLSLAEQSLALAHPEWLVRAWKEAYGLRATIAICRANNRKPALCLRVNRLRMTQDALIELLRANGMVARPGVAPGSVVVERGFDPRREPAFRDGLCTVQDASSMLAALVLDPKPGQRVLDACAAPGGKATHLAELMENVGDLVACDIHANKLTLIQSACKRLGITCVQTIAGDANAIADTEEPFDAVLLDAPCSGLGVLRRRPEIKWRKMPAQVESLAQSQLQLLHNVSRAVKPGGVLVYSTCTIMPQENQQIVEQFVLENELFCIEPIGNSIGDAALAYMNPAGWLQVLPHYFDSDGFFIAKLRRLQ